nr:uncharacterized protein LOC129381586 isoform X2 [Dermacentor andersoni]
MCVGAVFLFGVAAPWCCRGRRSRNYARRNTSLRSARACVESCDRAAICQRRHILLPWLMFLTALNPQDSTDCGCGRFIANCEDEAASWPEIGRPFYLRCILWLDHSNDLGGIVTQEEVWLAPSLVQNEEMALHIDSCLLVVITSLLA